MKYNNINDDVIIKSLKYSRKLKKRKITAKGKNTLNRVISDSILNLSTQFKNADKRITILINIFLFTLNFNTFIIIIKFRKPGHWISFVYYKPYDY